MVRKVLSFLTLGMVTVAFFALFGVGFMFGLVTGVEDAIIAGIAVFPAPRSLKMRVSRQPQTRSGTARDNAASNPGRETTGKLTDEPISSAAA